MREIKFRAWDKVNKVWLDGCLKPKDSTPRCLKFREFEFEKIEIRAMRKRYKLTEIK